MTISMRTRYRKRPCRHSQKNMAAMEITTAMAMAMEGTVTEVEAAMIMSLKSLAQNPNLSLT